MNARWIGITGACAVGFAAAIIAVGALFSGSGGESGAPSGRGSEGSEPYGLAARADPAGLGRQERSLVESQEDRLYAELLAVNFHARSDPPLTDAEVDLALRVLEGFDPARPEAEAGFDRSDAAALALGMLSRFWVQGDPTPEQERASLEHAARLVQTGDDVVAMSAVALLETIRRMRPDGELPPRAAEALREGMGSDLLRHYARRFLESLEEAAAEVGRTFPGE
jgi:hypothetical protein